MSYAIISQKDKDQRLKKVDSFISKYGRGDQKLSNDQKNNRMEKYLSNGTMIDKVIGLGRYPLVGVPLLDKSAKRIFSEDHEGTVDSIPESFLKDIKNYPHDIRFGEDHKIIFMKVHDNGSIEVEHLIIDGKENDPKTRTLSGLMIFDDKTSAENEYRQFKKGILKEVSDRTMIFHKEKGLINDLLEHPDIDTDEDKPGQI